MYQAKHCTFRVRGLLCLYLVSVHSSLLPHGRVIFMRSLGCDSPAVAKPMLRNHFSCYDQRDFKKPPVRFSCSCICPYDVGNGPWIKSTLIVTWNLVQSITCLCLVYFPLAVYQQSELLYPLQCFFLSINLHNKCIKVNSTMVKKSTSECRPIDDSSV